MENNSLLNRPTLWTSGATAELKKKKNPQNFTYTGEDVFIHVIIKEVQKRDNWYLYDVIC